MITVEVGPFAITARTATMECGSVIDSPIRDPELIEGFGVVRAKLSIEQIAMLPAGKPLYLRIPVFVSDFEPGEPYSRLEVVTTGASTLEFDA